MFNGYAKDWREVIGMAREWRDARMDKWIEQLEGASGVMRAEIISALERRMWELREEVRRVKVGEEREVAA